MVITEEKFYIYVLIGISTGGGFVADDVLWEGRLVGKDILWGGRFVFRAFLEGRLVERGFVGRTFCSEGCCWTFCTSTA
jgi:hypothetical protein